VALLAEFTVEPFVEGAPGAHVTAAFDAVRREGLEVEFGPFGTTVAGDDATLLDAVNDALRAAFAHGATRVSVQISA
jgi:uncharacterized protein YqgV (UPF0045/DUF77 family)